ncbi:MAG: YebC/PmpR family DNA-binding transcriptional regulator [Coprothermobacterota bacterium]|jgi:YebC/PmpR family DNA-binding regulatory protein|nr:YebC/PmpR family DNA-binding transcriptional regulator [Coprothermobacterota bacterium]
MSGHSKWHNIRAKKSAADAERGRIFTKLTREITAATREGGGNPDTNVRLRVAIEKARENNVPADTIKRAIQKGTGELPGQTFEQVFYEGYGPGGVAVLVEASTDNRNRTSASIRHLFSRYGGNLGEVGCVNWLFHRKGLIQIERNKEKEEDLMLTAIDAGAEDFREEADYFEVICPPENLFQVKEALEKLGAKLISAEISMVPNTYVKLAGEEAQKMLALTNALEDHDDVVQVYANFDISDEEMAKFTAA